MNKSKIVAICIPANGYTALEEFFAAAPTNSNVAYIVITNLPHNSKASLQPVLTNPIRPLILLSKDTVPQGSNIYILPVHLKATIKDGVLMVSQRLTSAVTNPIDQFLFSFAKDQRENAISIIFSGLGSDGLLGIRAIQECGGLVFIYSPLH